VARLEQCAIPDPRLSTVIAISKALGVGVDSLLEELAEEKPAPKRKGPAMKPAEDPPVVSAILDLVTAEGRRMTQGQIVRRVMDLHPDERGFSEGNIESWLGKLRAAGRLRLASHAHGQSDGKGKGFGLAAWGGDK